MDVQESIDTSSIISQLINSLSSGEIDPSDFRVKTNQCSQTMTKNLFRDSLPKFSSNLRSKATDIFIRCFFKDDSYQNNELWKFVDYKDFWIQLRNFHDFVYFRNMTFNDVIKFFEENLACSNSQLNLSYLEQKIIKQLDQSPHMLNKDLAQQFNVSEKKISNMVNNLKSKGIYVGCLVDYPALDSCEFFTFGSTPINNEKAVLLQKYELFPNFTMGYGVSSEKLNNSSSYNVINKKISCNTRILTMGISLKDWSKHPIKRKKKISTNQKKEELTFYITPMSKDYILQLVRNCEKDFRRPNIKEIADINNVSIRTLFRIKSKLKDMGIIEPRIIVENEELMTILMVSDKELMDLHDKVPFIKSYEIQDNKNNIKWMSFLSIFPSDFNFIYKNINKSVDVFQVIEKRVLNQIKNNERLLLHLEQKT